ncbi:MAG: hypothetical protein WBC91_20660 [Phototrophicaceae bacterium]
MKLVRYVLLITIFSFGAFLVTAFVVNGSGSVNTSDTIQGRIFRISPASSCANNKGFPGDFNSGTTYAFAQEGPFAAGESGCATVTWSTDCIVGGDVNLHPVALSAPLNTSAFNNNSGNYLGDPGSSSIFTFSFNVTSGQDIYLAFINPNSIEACNYTYTIDIPGDAPVEMVEEMEDEPFVPLDSRINRFDAGAPIAVYANGQGGVDIYTITVESTGIFVLQANDMADAPCDGSAIATNGEIGVYRTSDCAFQVNAPQLEGKTYVLRFEVISSLADYESYEE